MELFDRNKKTIKQIKDDFEAGKLIIDSSYQRRSVWTVQDNIRLIETILIGYIIPEVFLWPASVDPETGDTVTHIVDGQQRINAIIDFIEGKYKLSKKYLLDESIVERCGDKFFTENPNAVFEIWDFGYKFGHIIDMEERFIHKDYDESKSSICRDLKVDTDVLRLNKQQYE